MDFVEKIYSLTRSFPVEEKFALTQQMRRSAVSIPSNIAEGHNRRSLKIYLNHLDISLGSLNECLTQIEIATRLHYLSQNDGQKILKDGDILRRQIISLTKSLQR